MTPVLGCARMAMTTHGHGCARGEVILTFCHIAGSRSGEWAMRGHGRMRLSAPTALTAPTALAAPTRFMPSQGKGSGLEGRDVLGLDSARV